MGYWLTKTFKSEDALEHATSGTDVFQLPSKGIISNLLIEILAYSGTSNAELLLADAIDKVEVIGNGSTVIQSIDGRQIQASAAYDDLRMPPDKELAISAGCYGYFDIRFGRFTGDQKYALDCSKWDSLELKITYNLACTEMGGTIETTGFKTTTGYIQITGLYSPDGAGLSPVGYIKKEEKKTYTTAADGSEDLALPNDYPFRRLLLATETHAYWFHQGWRYITIDINNGARKPIDNMGGEELMRLQLAIAGNPMWSHWKRYYFASGLTNYHPCIRWCIDASVGIVTGAGTTVISGLDPLAISVTTTGINYSSINERGYLPWGTLAIDLERQSGKDGREAMMDCWGYDQMEDIHLKHTQWSASVALSVVLEQYATK